MLSPAFDVTWRIPGSQCKHVRYFFLVSRCGMKLRPLGTSANNWPLVPTRMIDGDCAFDGMRIGRRNRSTLG
jgi:hypothetical protein